MGELILGDNLPVMRGMAADSVDLIYADPPFASQRDYGDFDDRWKLESEPSHKVAKLASKTHSPGMAAFLDFMAVRIVEMQRVLKPTGSIYLHVDPTASHYLKATMDAIFGVKNYRNEVVWCYTGPASPKMKQFSRKHDTIFWYSNGGEWTFNKDAIRIPHADGGPHSGGFKQKTGESMDKASASDYGRKGKIPETWWAAAPGNGLAVACRSPKQYTGYSTQKPLALLERIIRASSNEGDLVLDPFCGSGSTLVAAKAMRRQFVGVDRNPDALRIAARRLDMAGQRQGMLDV